MYFKFSKIGVMLYKNYHLAFVLLFVKNKHFLSDVYHKILRSTKANKQIRFFNGSLIMPNPVTMPLSMLKLFWYIICFLWHVGFEWISNTSVNRMFNFSKPRLMLCNWIKTLKQNRNYVFFFFFSKLTPQKAIKLFKNQNDV